MMIVLLLYIIAKDKMIQDKRDWARQKARLLRERG